MYLSLLKVDVGGDPNRERPGRRWLRNPYEVHQRLSMAFVTHERRKRDPDFLQPWDGHDRRHCHVPRDGRCGFLFRVEPAAAAQILVQSAGLPDWDYAFANARFLLRGPPAVRAFDPVIRAGQRLRFRLRANPTMRKTVPDREAGLRVGVVGEDRLRAWLHAKARAGGFTVDGDRLLAISEGRIVGRKPGGTPPLAFQSVRFEGVLEVTDPDRFLATLAAGIGSAKAFGFGLLSLARAGP